MTDKTLTFDQELDKEALISAIEELDASDMEATDKYVMGELLRAGKNDIYFKSDLNFTQIRGIVKLLSIDKIMKAQSLPEDQGKKELESVPTYLTHLLMKLVVSNKRKGRIEFIKAWVGHEDKLRREEVEKWLGS